jgi:hypothetical protein
MNKYTMIAVNVFVQCILILSIYMEFFNVVVVTLGPFCIQLIPLV